MNTTSKEKEFFSQLRTMLKNYENNKKEIETKPENNDDELVRIEVKPLPGGRF